MDTPVLHYRTSFDLGSGVLTPGPTPRASLTSADLSALAPRHEPFLQYSDDVAAEISDVASDADSACSLVSSSQTLMPALVVRVSKADAEEARRLDVESRIAVAMSALIAEALEANDGFLSPATRADHCKLAGEEQAKKSSVASVLEDQTVPSPAHCILLQLLDLHNEHESYAPLERRRRRSITDKCSWNTMAGWPEGTLTGTNGKRGSVVEPIMEEDSSGLEDSEDKEGNSKEVNKTATSGDLCNGISGADVIRPIETETDMSTAQRAGTDSQELRGSVLPFMNLNQGCDNENGNDINSCLDSTKVNQDSDVPVAALERLIFRSLFQSEFFRAHFVRSLDKARTAGCSVSSVGFTVRSPFICL